jgi:hypothetical protein
MQDRQTKHFWEKYAENGCYSSDTLCFSFVASSSSISDTLLQASILYLTLGIIIVTIYTLIYYTLSPYHFVLIMYKLITIYFLIYYTAYPGR